MAQARGEFRKAGLDVKIVTPSDPAAPLKLLAAGRADLAISYEPEVLLARDKNLGVLSVGALAPAAADLADGRQGPLGRPEEAGGQARRDRRHPLPGRLPRRDPPERRRRPGDGQARERRLQPRAGDALRARSTRRSARSGTSRACSCAWTGAARRSRPSTRSACRPTTSSCSRPATTPCSTTARRCGASCRRSSAARAPPATTRRRRSTRCVAAAPDLERRFAEASVKATLPVLFPEDRSRAVRLPEPAAVAGLRRLDARATTCSRGPSTSGRWRRTSSCRVRGSETWARDPTAP